jgi:hypothetical protein
MVKALRSGPKDDLGEMVARVAVGTVGLAYFYRDEKKKQEEGLQWFEHRGSDGTVQNITNMFPYSVYALLGRITHNWIEGEGMDKGLIEALRQQVGPLEALEQLSLPTFVKDFTRWATDVNVDTGERGEVFGTIGEAVVYVGAQVAEIAAGVTRPLDIYSRTVSYRNPEAGGGLIADPKQAEGIDKIVLGLTRYTSAFFNFAFGEKTEYGPRLLGKPRENASTKGPLKIPNPAGTATGFHLQPQSRNLNKLLGMVDKPPYKADSFTSGNPEYDAFINKHVTPLLEAKASSLLKNEVFLKSPMSVKMKIVDAKIKEARDEVLNLLEGRRIGDNDDRLIDLRRKLLVKDRAARQRAMEALGISTPERKLSRYEIEAIERYMDVEEDKIQRIK